MPNRIIKESICTSEQIDALSPEEEVLFYRLLVNCDDFGRFDGRPAIVKSRLFPLKDIAVGQVNAALQRLAALGLIERYEVDGRPLLQVVTWEKHQRLRNRRSKYPSSGGQLTATCPPESESQSQSESEPETIVSCTEADKPSGEAVITLPLNNHTEYAVTQDDVNRWQPLYPAVDVMTELRKMVGWLEARPERCKTRNGIKKFIIDWLGREQDSARAAPPARKKAAAKMDSEQAKAYEALLQNHVPKFRKQGAPSPKKSPGEGADKEESR